jgi:hypothetical protein
METLGLPRDTRLYDRFLATPRRSLSTTCPFSFSVPSHFLARAVLRTCDSQSRQTCLAWPLPLNRSLGRIRFAYPTVVATIAFFGHLTYQSGSKRY